MPTGIVRVQPSSIAAYALSSLTFAVWLYSGCGMRKPSIQETGRPYRRRTPIPSPQRRCLGGDRMSPLKLRRFLQISRWLAVGILLFYCGVAHVPAGLGQPDEVGQEIAALKDANPQVRWDAAKALGRSKDPRAVDPLIAALKNTGDTPLRTEAAKALGEINDPRGIDPLIEALESSEYGVRGEAFHALGEIKDPRAIGPMMALEKDPYRYTTFSVKVLEGFGTSAVEPLIVELKDPSSRVRQTAVMLLGEFKDPRAVEPLSAALLDTDHLVRIGAAEALGRSEEHTSEL